MNSAVGCGCCRYVLPGLWLPSQPQSISWHQISLLADRGTCVVPVRVFFFLQPKLLQCCKIWDGYTQDHLLCISFIHFSWWLFARLHMCEIILSVEYAGQRSYSACSYYMLPSDDDVIFTARWGPPYVSSACFFCYSYNYLLHRCQPSRIYDSVDDINSFCWLGSVVVGRRTSDRKIAGLTPGQCIAG